MPFKLSPTGVEVDINLPQQGEDEQPLLVVDPNTEVLREILVELRITNILLNEVYDLNVTQRDVTR